MKARGTGLLSEELSEDALGFCHGADVPEANVILSGLIGNGASSGTRHGSYLGEDAREARRAVEGAGIVRDIIERH